MYETDDFGVLGFHILMESHTYSEVPQVCQTARSSCFSAFFWGLAVDVVGRRWAFNLTCLITGVFGMIVAAPNNYPGVCALTLRCGIGLGGNIPIDASIVIEFLPQNRRWLLPLLSM